MNLKAEGWGEKVNYLGSDLREDRDTRRRRRCEDRDTRRLWWVCIVLLPEKMRSDWDDAVRTERAVVCGGIGSFFWQRRRDKTEETPWGPRHSSSMVGLHRSSAGEDEKRLRWRCQDRKSSCVVGLDPFSDEEDERRQRRRREDRENRRLWWWVSILPLWRRRQEDENEDGWSVVEDRCGEECLGFRSVVGFIGFDPFPSFLTCGWKTSLKIGHQTPHLRIGNPFFLFFWFN